jgi:hypothetical protein
VKRRFGFGNLDFAGYEALRAGSLLEPPSEKRLSTAIITPDRFEAAAPKRDRVKVLIKARRKAIHANRKRIEPEAGHRTSAQRVDNLTATMRAKRHYFDPNETVCVEV